MRAFFRTIGLILIIGGIVALKMLGTGYLLYCIPIAVIGLLLFVLGFWPRRRDRRGRRWR